MSLEQTVVFAIRDVDSGTWTAKVGDQSVTHLGPIAERLAANGWEIVSVVPTLENTTSETRMIGLTPPSLTVTSMLAIFAKRVGG